MKLPVVVFARKHRPMPTQLSRAPGAITRAEERLLRLFGRLETLTAAQVRRRYYGNSQRYVEGRLVALATQRYLLRLPYRSGAGAGRVGSVFAISQKGCALLAEIEAPHPTRWRDGEIRARTPYAHDHALAVNDVLITLEQAAESAPQLRIEEDIPERVLRREPIYLKDDKGTKTAVVFDRFLRLRTGPQTLLNLALEVDMGTTLQRPFRAKIAGLLAALDGPYQERFQAKSVTIAFVAMGHPSRKTSLTDLVSWTEAELVQLGAEAFGQFFHFTAADPTGHEPAEFVAGAHWRVPFRADLVPLLEPGEGGL
jgi:hypothetical protein